MPNDTAIIIMAKQPQVGRTKTRLCPPLLPAQAADLSEALLRDSIALVTGLAAPRPAAEPPGEPAEPAGLNAATSPLAAGDGPAAVAGLAAAADLALAITPAGARSYFEGITPPGTRLVPVDGKDIGACLVQALEALLQAGYRKALALNADGPSLPPAYLLQAIAALDAHDLVLGPAQDGGYYLIGLKEMDGRLFDGIAWSTPQVLRQTLAQAVRLGRHAWLAPVWYDIDSAADLQHLQSELSELPLERLPFTRRFLADFPPPSTPA